MAKAGETQDRCTQYALDVVSGKITAGEYVRKHLKHLFSRQVSYNRFVELKKEAWFPSEHFHQEGPVGNLYMY